MSKTKKPVSIRAKGLTFDVLAEAIRLIDNDIAAQVGRAVNIGLTLRNWLIGHRIAEYELNGADRAKYGEGLLAKLSRKLEVMQVSGCGKRQLYQYLRFYQTYPRIVRSVTAQFPALISEGVALAEKVRSPAAQSGVAHQDVLRRLSYTHTLPSGDFATDLGKHLIENGEYEPKGVTDFDVHEILWICHRNA